MKVDDQKASAISKVCLLLSQQRIGDAKDVIDSEYPFLPVVRAKRTYTPRQMTKVFLRDGFIDRYNGQKLVYPPVLRIISRMIPESFPYHKNGKMDEGHIAYWQLFPTIDHLDPVARGGPDTETNWICCSMLTNSIKANWTLEELGWTLLAPGNVDEWDGMLRWFVDEVERKPEHLDDSYIKTWYSAACHVLEDQEIN